MLMQFDPFREFDRLAEQLAAVRARRGRFRWMRIAAAPSSWFRLTCPGTVPATIDLTIEQNVLTIKAERRFDG